MNRSTTLLIGCTTLFFACGEGTGTGQDPEGTGSSMSELEARVAALTGNPMADEQSDGYDAVEPVDGGSGGPTGGTRTYTLNGTAFNMPLAQLELPAHWQVRGMETGNWSVTAPVKVQQGSPMNFSYAGGQLGRFNQANNVPMRAPIAPDQVVMQDLVPYFRQQGYELIGHRPIPEVARVSQIGMDNLYAVGQVQRICRADLSEWRRGDDRLAVVMNWFSIAGSDLVNWGYSTTALQAPSGRYEAERDGLLNGFASVRYNPAYFAAYAQSEQQKEQQSWSAHNARMRSRQAAFDAQQAAHRDRVNSVNDAIMGTWNNTSATMDRMHEATIDGIRGEQNAWNPHTGAMGKVESGYQNYWVNSDGQYFGTNDVNHDPNANGQWVGQWQQMSTEP